MIPSRRFFALIAACTCSPLAAGGFPAVLDLASLEPENGGDGRAGVVFRSALPGMSGYFTDAAVIADVNGDGFDDLVLGAPAAGPGSAPRGLGFVVFGRARAAARVDLDALDGRDGFRVDPGSGDPRQFQLGHKVAGNGDLNGDGANDLLIASNRSAFVVFGHAGGGADFPARLDLGALDGSDGARIDLGSIAPHFDASIGALGAGGDLDGDGIDDLLASDANWRRAENAPNVGALYAVFGRRQFPAALGVVDLDGSDGFRVAGSDARRQLGSGGIAGGRDVDGDGLADLLANDDQRGLLLLGRPGPFAGTIELPVPDGNDGFAFLAGNAPDFDIAAAGDLNGDGRPDLVFSEMERSYTGPWQPGRTVFVVFGHAAPFPATLDAGQLDGGNGFRYLAEPDADLAGARAAGIGDLNADGVDDLAIYSLRCCSGPELPDRSVVHVVFGRRDGFPAQMDESVLDGRRGFRIDVSAANGARGRVAGGGDVDADGIDDLLVVFSHSEGGLSDPHLGDFAYLLYGCESPLFADGFDAAR